MHYEALALPPLHVRDMNAITVKRKKSFPYATSIFLAPDPCHSTPAHQPVSLVCAGR